MILLLFKRGPRLREPSGCIYGYGLGDPQFGQNLPVLTAPQLHVHSAGAGFGDPQFGQNLPVFTDPQLHVQLCAAGVPALWALPAAPAKAPPCAVCC